MSLYFTGFNNPGNPERSDLIVYSNAPGLNFGYNNFTIEWWQYLQKDYNTNDNTNTYPHVFMSGYRDGPTNIGVTFQYYQLLYWENSEYYAFSLPFYVKDQWVHFSINRIYYPWLPYCTTRIFMNGQQIGQVQSRENINCSGYNLVIGNRSVSKYSGAAFQGYLTNFVILNGICLHDYEFVPPLQPRMVDKYTTLLLMGTENGEIVPYTGGDQYVSGRPADFYGTASGIYIDSPYTTKNNPNPLINSNVYHTSNLPDGFNVNLPIMVDPNIEIARVKKTPLFSGQLYSAVLRKRNYDTTKIEVPMSWANGYYVKDERENNSRNEALRRARAGGANVPKKVTKILNAQQMFSN